MTFTSLLAELSHRKVPRARNLNRRVVQALSVMERGPSEALVIKPLAPGELRFAAEHFLKGEVGWTLEERTEAASIARHQINLAKLIEKRLKKQN